MAIENLESPNFDERTDGAAPAFLILHYTGTPDAQTAQSLYMQEGNVSPHYMISEDGNIKQFVDESKRAWHAGPSFWSGVEDINSQAIGIELVNPGHAFGYRAFPLQQMHALIALCKDITGRHNIAPCHVLGHSDIAPGRKIDPGELFDWRLLSGHGVGVWPVPVEEDYAVTAPVVFKRSWLKRSLESYGYDPRIDLQVLVTAFQRHFRPAAFGTAGEPGLSDHEMAARLHCLMRMKPSQKI